MPTHIPTRAGRGWMEMPGGVVPLQVDIADSGHSEVAGWCQRFFAGLF